LIVAAINPTINLQSKIRAAMGDTLGIWAASDLPSAAITRFVRQVEGAAALLVVAHSGEKPRSAPVKALARRAAPSMTLGQGHGWHRSLVSTSTSRLQDLVVVFANHPVHGPGAQAELEAFKMLLELTPAGPPLLVLANRDRRRAYEELAKHMELVCRQFEAAATLADSLTSPGPASGAAPKAEEPAHAGFAAVRDALLDRAGGALTLTEAAKRLGISRQALHKRISAGTALGMMVDDEIVVPSLQIATRDDRPAILGGIGDVTKLFKSAEAGPWMALQFLVDPDPNLGRDPVESLQEGEIKPVIAAARAHLRCDEG